MTSEYEMSEFRKALPFMRSTFRPKTKSFSRLSLSITRLWVAQEGGAQSSSLLFTSIFVIVRQSPVTVSCQSLLVMPEQNYMVTKRLQKHHSSITRMTSALSYVVERLFAFFRPSFCLGILVEAFPYGKVAVNHRANLKKMLF